MWRWWLNTCREPPLVEAPNLTVVSTPPRNQALERMGRTPPLRGWCPSRRWHRKRQEFLHGPTVVGDARCHGGSGPATGAGETRMRCGEIIDRPDEIHAMLQRQGAARQRTPAACQRGQPCTEGGVEPLNVGRIDHPVPLRPASKRLHPCRCAIDHTAFRVDHSPALVAFD